MTTQTSATDSRTARTSAELGGLANREWLPLPGGELEAPRIRALCPSCRAAGRRSLCLNCFRTERDRERQLVAARDLHTASEARFQYSLPFEPVNRARLNQLRAARQSARVDALQGVGRYVDKRRQAQIAARHALQRLAEGLRVRGVQLPSGHPAMGEALHAVELQVPESWLPFVAQSASGGSSSAAATASVAVRY